LQTCADRKAEIQRRFARQFGLSACGTGKLLTEERRLTSGLPFPGWILPAAPAKQNTAITSSSAALSGCVSSKFRTTHGEIKCAWRVRGFWLRSVMQLGV